MSLRVNQYKHRYKYIVSSQKHQFLFNISRETSFLIKMTDLSDEALALGSRSKLTTAVEGGLILLINFVALFGNLLICCVIYIKPRFHTTTNTFILALSAANGFIASLVMPFTSASLITGKWQFGQTLCDVQGFTFLALTWIYLLTLILAVSSRLLQLTWLPLYNKWFSVDRVYSIIMAIWVIVIIIPICLEAVGASTYRFYPEAALCSLAPSKGDNSLGTSYAVITLVLCKALTVLSLLTWCKIKRHINVSVHASGQVQEGREIVLRILAEKRKTNRVLLFLTTAVLLFWLPTIVIRISAFSIRLPRQIHLASTFFWISVPVIHPIIYGALHRPFSREILRAMPRVKNGKNRVHAEHTVWSQIDLKVTLKVAETKDRSGKKVISASRSSFISISALDSAEP